MDEPPDDHLHAALQYSKGPTGSPRHGITSLTERPLIGCVSRHVSGTGPTLALQLLMLKWPAIHIWEPERRTADSSSLSVPLIRSSRPQPESYVGTILCYCLSYLCILSQRNVSGPVLAEWEADQRRSRSGASEGRESSIRRADQLKPARPLPR